MFQAKSKKINKQLGSPAFALLDLNLFLNINIYH